MSDFRRKIEGEIVADSAELLRYRAVKKLLGCKSNGPIRKLVNDGKLIRVRVGPFSTQLRITKASLASYLHELNEVKETKKEFGISDGEWAERARNAKRDRAMFGQSQVVEDNGTVADPSKIVTIGDLGNFAMTSDDYMDVLSRRLVPAGCYIDADESLVCGQIAPCFLERILKIRMQRRGMNTSEARYHASQISEKVAQSFVGENEKRVGDARRKQAKA
jgi:hypothetical protein